MVPIGRNSARTRTRSVDENFLAVVCSEHPPGGNAHAHGSTLVVPIPVLLTALTAAMESIRMEERLRITVAFTTLAAPGEEDEEEQGEGTRGSSR